MKNTWKFFSLTLVLALLALSVASSRRPATAVDQAVSPATLSATLDWELILPDVPTRLWRSSTYEIDRTLYVTTEQEMLRSTDDGDTWTTLFATRPYSENLRISAMAWDPGAATSPTLFVVRNVGYVYGEVFRSTDDGLTWEMVFSAPEQAMLLYDIAAVRDADDNLVVFAVGFSPHLPAVWRSADGGDTWVLADGGLLEWTDLYKVYPSPNFAADHTVYMTGYGPLHRSTDGGLTWERLSIPGRGLPRTLIFSPNYAIDGTLWISYFFVEGSGEDDIYNGVVRSTDFGATWQIVNTGLAENWLDASLMALAVSPDYPEDSALYAIQRSLQYSGTPWMLYRTPNGGDRWWAQGLAPEAMPKGLVVVSRDLLFLPTIDGLWRLRNHSWEWLVNGDADTDEGWSFPITPSTAGYSTAQVRSGVRSIRLGIVGTANRHSYSSARQRVTLPATATSAQLSLWLYPVSTEVKQASFSPEMVSALTGLAPAAPAAGDAQFILIMDDQERILQRLLWTLDNSQTWKPYTFDMSAYIGRSIWVHFGVYNDGVGGITGMYVDDVSLTATEPLPAKVEPPGNSAAIGEDFLVTDAAGYQNVPAAAFNPADDEFLLVYRDSRGYTSPDVYAQRVRSDGRLVGDAIVVCDYYDGQDTPQVAYLAGAERYLVVWQDSRHAGETPDVYGQLVRRDGSLDGGNFPVAVDPGGHFRPRLVAGVDDFLVVWGHVTAETARIQGQRVSGSGTLIGTRFDISDGTAWAGQPDVAYRPAAERYLVVWADGRGADQDIYAQQVLPDGTLAGDNIPVTHAPGIQEWPVLAASSGAAGGVDDAVLVVWEDWRNGDQRDIYGQRFKAGDTFLGIDIPISVGPGLAGMPAVAVWETTGASVFFVVWQAPAGRGDLHGQRLSATGQRIGAPFVVSDDPHTQARPAIAVARTAPQPVVWVVWEDYRVEQLGIYGQRLDANACKVGLHVGLSPLDGLQVRPVLAYSPLADHYLVAWHHVDSDGARIMAYRFNGDGALVWMPFEVATGIQTPDLALDVAWDALNDYFLVVWSDIAPGTVDDFDIFGQIIQPDGNELIGSKITISSAPHQQHAPAVAFSPELARYLVVFESVDPADQMKTLRGQFLTDEGVPLMTNVDENFLLTMPGANRQARYPDVAYDAASRSFLVVWQDNRAAPGGWDIYGQRVDGTTGTLLPVEFAIAAGTSHLAEFPSLTASTAGRYLVVWQDTEAVADGDGNVMGRMLTADGAPLGAPIPIAAQVAYHEGAPDVAYNARAKAFLVAWHGAPQDAYVPDIYARQLGSYGVPSTAVLPVAVADDSARHWPVVAARDGARGGAEWLIAWEDGRADRGAERIGVYARRQQAIWSVYLPLVMRNR